MQDRGSRLAVNDLICAELLSFIRDRSQLASHLKEAYISILPHTLDDALRGGELRAELAAGKRTMRGKHHLVDFIIAGQAMRLGALITADADFEVICRHQPVNIIII